MSLQHSSKFRWAYHRVNAKNTRLTNRCLKTSSSSPICFIPWLISTFSVSYISISCWAVRISFSIRCLTSESTVIKKDVSACSRQSREMFTCRHNQISCVIHVPGYVSNCPFPITRARDIIHGSTIDETGTPPVISTWPCHELHSLIDVYSATVKSDSLHINQREGIGFKMTGDLLFCASWCLVSRTTPYQQGSQHSQ